MIESLDYTYDIDIAYQTRHDIWYIDILNLFLDCTMYANVHIYLHYTLIYIKIKITHGTIRKLGCDETLIVKVSL